MRFECWALKNIVTNEIEKIEPVAGNGEMPWVFCNKDDAQNRCHRHNSRKYTTEKCKVVKMYLVEE